MRGTTTSTSTSRGTGVAPSRRARRERRRASRRGELRRRVGVALAALTLVATATASTSPLSSAVAGERGAAVGTDALTVAGAPTSARVAERPAAAPVLAAPAPLGSGSQVSVVDPVRLLSRTPLAAGEEVRVAVPDVPAGATAALLNVTVSAGTRDTTVTACPDDGACSLASAVPAGKNRVTPGQVLAPVVDGHVTVRNHVGDAEVFVDLAGFVRAPGDDTGGVVVPVEPRRVLSWQPVGERATHTLRLPDVPEGATAVVLDLGYAAATARGYVSACAGGTALLTCARTSVLNPDPDVNRSNLAVVPLGGGGGDEVLLYNHRGSVRLNADVQAYVVPAASDQEGLTAVEPAVVVDEVMPFGTTRAVPLPAVPDGATGVKLHVEARDAVGGAAIAVCPGAQASAACLKTSALSPYPGATTRALTYVGVADDAAVTVASTSSRVDVTVRVLGYVVAPEATAEATGTSGSSGGSPEGSSAGDRPATSGGSGSSSGGSGGSSSTASRSTSGVKPASATTGVPDGVSLTRHDGDLVIKEDGTVIDGLDVHGFISIRAKDVTIRNSVVRGSGPGSYSTGLVSCLDARCSGAVIEDTTLVPKTPSPWITGILGHDFTARNVDVHHVVDGFGIFDTNDPKGSVDVVIENSWCHDLAYFAKDPNQGNGPSHNDCIQIQGGSDIRITGNRLDSFMSTKAGDQSYDARNRGAALMVTPNVGPVTQVVMTGNWLDGGYATASFSAGKHAPMRFGTFAANTFGRNQYDHGRGSKYPIRVKDGVTFDRPLTTNVWADGSGRLAEGRDLGIRYE